MEQPSDFITIEQFEELCDKEDPKNPKVDIKLMVKRLPFLRAPGTWQVPLIKRGKDFKGRPISNYPAGYRYVAVESTRIENHIREAVEDAYKRLSGKELDVESIGLSKVDFATENGGVPQTGRRTNKKSGDSTEGGTLTGKAAADVL